LKEVVLNEGLKKIGSGAFCLCPIQSISIPSTLQERIEFSPYSSSIKFKFGTFYNLKHIAFNEGVRIIGYGAFRFSSTLQSISFPSTLIEIGKEAFNGCSKLREIRFKRGLRKIGIGSFGGCSSLESISFPSTLINVENNAFANCYRLKEVSLNERIKKIHTGAFNGCIGLDRFTFPTISTRLKAIVQAGQTEVMHKIDQIYGIERIGTELIIRTRESVIMAAGGDIWERFIRSDLEKIVKLIRFHEMKEATSLFELALWKEKINQAEGIPINRNACRIEVPGPVKDTILLYLYPFGDPAIRAEVLEEEEDQLIREDSDSDDGITFA